MDELNKKRQAAAQRVLELLKGLLLPAAPNVVATFREPADQAIYEQLVELGWELDARAREDAPLHYAYNVQYDTLEIEGVTYDGMLFRALGCVRGFEEGAVIKIVKRENSTVTLKRVKECIDVCKEAPTECPHCGEALTEET